MLLQENMKLRYWMCLTTFAQRNYMLMERLFLFAAYTPSGIVGESLLFYVRALNELGDVVLCADSSLNSGQADVLSPYVLHSEAKRHGEYDFGSYKRAWNWAFGNLELGSYDYIYLVNDSVFGPLFDLKPLLERLEAEGNGAFSLVYNPNRKAPHMQSWFIGLSRKVFSAGWFNDFLMSVTAAKDKNDVCRLYETGLTELLHRHGISIGFAFAAPHKTIYNSPLRFCRKGLPFVKKSSFVRHNGSVGYDITRIVREFPSAGTDAMVAEAARTWGAEYTDEITNMNRLASVLRHIKYLYGKLK